MTHSSSLPASANSSSTLIVVPIPLSMKTDDNPALDSQSVDPGTLLDATTEVANTDPGLPASAPPHTGLRAVSSRQSTPSQNRMSERGFVEPHHSNVPRRTRTRGKGQPHVPIRPIRTNSSAAPTPGGSPTSPSMPEPLIIEPPPLEQDAEQEEEFEQPITPLDTPNPNATRMPVQLLSLRLPSSPKMAAYTGLPASTPLPHTPALQPTASTGLPPASSVPHMPRAGLPQGIGLGFGTPLSAAAITPMRITTPLTPGSGRLPTRRRRAPVAREAETATPTRLFRGQGVRGTSAGSEELVGLPIKSAVQVHTADDAHQGPPSYGAYLTRMRDEASRERRLRQGLQRVGCMGVLEVGFLDGDGILGWDGLEDVPLDGSNPSAPDDLYVLLAEVDSDSDSDIDISDSGTGSSSNSEGTKRRVSHRRSVSRKQREERDRRELRLALPVDRRALIDGTCALMPSQLREACVFIREVVKTPSRVAHTPKVRPHLRILAPRGRPEDAMAIAITHLAYGDVLSSKLTDPTDEDDSNNSENILDAEDGNAPAPGAARLIAQTARAAGILTPNRSRRSSLTTPGALIDAIVDVEGGSPPRALDLTTPEPPLAPPSPIGFTDSELNTQYTPAHLLAMRLLDEGDWLARRRPGAQSSSGEDGVLGAGRGLVGVVDTSRPSLGGLFGVDLEGFGGEDEDEEDDYDGDTDEEGSGGSTAGSSADARVDSHSDSEGRDAFRNGSDEETEERRGRTVAWHGVPMPPKFVEPEDEASQSRERGMPSAPVDMDGKRKGKSKSKSRARGDPKSKSKSKSRARTRSRSQHPQNYLDDGDDVVGESASLRRPRTPAARRRARAAREMRRATRLARRVAEAEAYCGITDQWRGVLSYDGLAALGRVLEGAV